jgi:hypothetical protein
MTPASRLRLARLRLRSCRVRSAYARLRTLTRWRTLCVDLRQNPGHRRLLILGLLWLVASVWNWWMALYVLPSLVALVRQRSGTRFAFGANLLLGWTVLGWLFVLLWAIQQTGAPSRPVPVKTRVHWYVSPRDGRTIRV